MGKEKELELETLEVKDQEHEMETEDEIEEGEESTGDESETEDQDEDAQKDEEGGDDKGEEKADPIEAAKVNLEEQLKAAREALDEIREKKEFIEEEYERERQNYGAGISRYTWTSGGRHLYQLSNKEFANLVDQYIDAAQNAKTDADFQEYMLKIKEFNALRSEGANLTEYETKIETAELQLWLDEWGLVSKAILHEMPELNDEKALKTLQGLIEPIFINRKSNAEARFSYRKLSDGGSEAKFRYALKLIKEKGLRAEDKAGGKASTRVPTLGKGAGSASPHGKGGTTFTRAQIAKMSLAEFTRQEDAINKALKAGRIR